MKDEAEVLGREEQIGEPMPSRPTKRDLIERGLGALDANKMQGAKISMVAGCVAFANVIEVMDFAKSIATSGILLPQYLRGNAGACLGLTIQAIEWRMSPLQVMQKSFEVNGRVGYESQLLHAVIEARAPLQHRLDCVYDGDGPTRRCTIIGMFINGDVREYTSPMLKDIRVKNSPLWKDDPDQQLFYYASRSWARKWAPDVLMGIYGREELESIPAEETAPGLHARLVGSPRADEGHRIGHAEAQLAAVTANGTAVEARPALQKPADEEDSPDTNKPNKRTSGLPNGGKKRTKAEKKAKEPAAVEQPEAAPVVVSFPPTSVKGYLAWAANWIEACTDSDDLTAKWNKERKLRNDLGMTEDDREPLLDLIAKRRQELEN